MNDETVGETLQRLARASLPRHADDDEVDRNSNRRCVCGELLPANPKTRQKRKVCDDCAALTPRMDSGRPASCHCAECCGVFPRLKLKVKNYKYYCKKCLKIKFNIDF